MCNKEVLLQGRLKNRERSLFSHLQRATSGVTKQPAGIVHRRHRKHAARSQALVEEFNPSLQEARDDFEGRRDSFALWVQTTQ